jgi:hypothetical protein
MFKFFEIPEIKLDFQGVKKDEVGKEIVLIVTLEDIRVFL